ncbi:hypothetical protein MKW92_012296, partial [Papaver armeniacum]
MSKISSSINKQLKNTVIWRSYSTALGNLFRTSKSPIKHPNFPTPNAPVLGFSKTLSLKHSNSFSYTRLLLNLSFSSSHGGVTISSPHINNRHISSSDVNVGAPNIKKEHLLISIPVRAYFMFNRIDLKGLMADNQANLIPQTSGMTSMLFSNLGIVIPLDGVIAAFTELYSERNKMRSYVMRKRRMCRLVGRANSTLAEIMVRLGLFQRLEIASVDNPNYSQMWKYLRDQFGMEQKFVGLDFYLKLMEVFMQFVTTETTRGWQLTYSVLFISGYILIKLSPLGGCSLFSL